MLVEGISIFIGLIVLHMSFQRSNINDNNKTKFSGLKQLFCYTWSYGSEIWAGAQLVDSSVLYGINSSHSMAFSCWLVWRIQHYFTQMSGVLVGMCGSLGSEGCASFLCSLRASPCGLPSTAARLFNIIQGLSLREHPKRWSKIYQ